MSEQGKLDKLSELLSQLTFDTAEWAVASTDSLRAVVATAAREQGRFDVAVHLQPNRTGALDALSGTKVALGRADGACVAEARIDGAGHVVFRGVPAGKYRFAVAREQDALPQLGAENTGALASRSLQGPVRASFLAEQSLDLVEGGRGQRWECDGTPWPGIALPLPSSDVRPRLWNWTKPNEHRRSLASDAGVAMAEALGWANVDWHGYSDSFRGAVERSAGMATLTVQHARAASHEPAKGE
jgi:hypothetical protein